MADNNQNSELERHLRAAEAAKAGQYDKRTEHLDEDGRAMAEIGIETKNQEGKTVVLGSATGLLED